VIRSRAAYLAAGTLAVAAAFAMNRPAVARSAPAPQGIDSAMIVSRGDRDAETARLRAFGVNVPDGGIVLERPWDPPYTRRSFVVPQAWFAVPAPDSVSADALAKDLPVLAAVMERAYGGWDVAEKRGWSWAKWFADWGVSLRAHSGQRLAVIEAFAPMKQFMAFQLDNHTTIPLRGASFGSGSQTALVQGSPTAPCTQFKAADGQRVALDANDPAQRVRHALRWNATTHALEPAAYLSLPTNRGIPASLQCGAQTVALTPAWPPSALPVSPETQQARRDVIFALSGATADEPDFKLLEPAIAYIRLPTFSKANSQLIEQRMGSWPTPTGSEKTLIVDLRNNGGGDANLETVARWIEVKRMNRAMATHRHQGASCLYHALRWGYVTSSSQGLKPPVSASMTRSLQTSMDDLFKPSAAGCPRAFDDSNSEWDYRQHKMLAPGPVAGHRRVMVLVNNGTGSDGEYMLELLASLPEAVVVGINTFGVAQYIQPGYSVLPHTRLPFRVALGTSDGYGDNRSFDGYGFDVDVVLSTKEDQSPANILALARFIGGR